MADFEEASVSAFREVFGNITVPGRLLVPLRTGLDEACEQKRPEGGLTTHLTKTLTVSFTAS